MRNELEKIRIHAVVAYFKIPFRNYPGVNKENHENPRSRQPSPSSDLNPGPPKYEAELLTNQARRSVSWSGSIF
jgi:hypothetical protein